MLFHFDFRFGVFGHELEQSLCNNYAFFNLRLFLFDVLTKSVVSVYNINCNYLISLIKILLNILHGFCCVAVKEVNLNIKSVIISSIEVIFVYNYCCFKSPLFSY